VPKAWISRRLGGDQIDYADERPEIRDWFQRPSAKHGLEPNMEKAYEGRESNRSVSRAARRGERGLGRLAERYPVFFRQDDGHRAHALRAASTPGRRDSLSNPRRLQ